MKKLLLLVALAVIASILMVGCGDIDYVCTNPSEAINVGVNKGFTIALDSNPTTGYEWQPTYDKTMLELVEKTYKQGETAKQGMVGAGGVEYFKFKALKPGEAKVTMDYKRSWEKENIEQLVFTVNVK